jgi:hypothetical protein
VGEGVAMSGCGYEWVWFLSLVVVMLLSSVDSQGDVYCNVSVYATVLSLPTSSSSFID